MSTNNSDRMEQRKLRQLDRLARRNARKEQFAKRKELREQFRKSKLEIVQNQESKIVENKETEQSRLNMINSDKKDMKEQFKNSKNKKRRLSGIRRKRRTSQFMKFSNRVWWKSYLTILAWILFIFLVIVGLFYILKAAGLDLSSFI